MKKILMMLVAGLAFAGGFIVAYRLVSPSDARPVAVKTHRDLLEERFGAEGKSLRPVSLNLKPLHAAHSLLIDRKALAAGGLYLKDPRDESDYVYIDPAGAVAVAGGEQHQIENVAELLVTAHDVTLFLDDRPLKPSLAGWQAFRVGGDAPALRTVDYPRYEMDDSFMRESFGDSDYWTKDAGQWRLNQHGGGAPEEERELRSYRVQRAVNPFTVLGSGNGTLTYGDATWINYHAEACFYFGVPRTGHVSDLRTLPTGTDMLVAQGAPDGTQVAFGWRGAEKTFALMQRQKGGDWRVLWRWTGGRPPLSNWVRIGLSVRSGHVAEAYLDGARVAERDLDCRVAGPLHVLCGKDLIEFDDARAWSLPAPPHTGSPVYVQSRFFAEKRDKHNSDPEQFDQWAKSTTTFARLSRLSGGALERVEIVTRMPLMGDFHYESRTSSKEADAPLPGAYEISLCRKPPEAACELDSLKPVFTLTATFGPGGWTVTNVDGKPWQQKAPLPSFSLMRVGDDSSRILLKTDGPWTPVSRPLPGPLHFAVARLNPKRPRFPEPDNHRLYCANLFNEFFEGAPTDWNWVDGSFRMDCRWACQNLWNFMACGSPGTPLLTSKRTYSGDQEHEYFITLRPVFPNDGGDPNFSYDPRQDHGLRIFKQNGGWYTTRDLDFSFCTDGRNPLSGYSVVFGGEDNRVTRLLRRGKVVAERRDFLFHTQPRPGGLHWKWWRFRVRKYGTRILVDISIDDFEARLFDYTDPHPIGGGHVGFWTLRNGFIVSRVVSVAQHTGYDPRTLYVQDDDPSPWQPLLRDSVTLRKQPEPLQTRVTANVGGGWFAVRWKPAAPVDLKKTPLLELPIKVNPGARVNVHLMIGGRSYLIHVNAPVTAMKELLSPEFETEERFRIPTLKDDQVKQTRLLADAKPDAPIRLDLYKRLREISGILIKPELTSITVGNSSNEDYLLAGNGANQAGASYELGTPRFLKAE